MPAALPFTAPFRNGSRHSGAARRPPRRDHRAGSQQAGRRKAGAHALQRRAQGPRRRPHQRHGRARRRRARRESSTTPSSRRWRRWSTRATACSHSPAPDGATPTSGSAAPTTAPSSPESGCTARCSAWPRPTPSAPAPVWARRSRRWTSPTPSSTCSRRSPSGWPPASPCCRPTSGEVHVPRITEDSARQLDRRGAADHGERARRRHRDRPPEEARRADDDQQRGAQGLHAAGAGHLRVLPAALAEPQARPRVLRGNRRRAPAARHRRTRPASRCRSMGAAGAAIDGPRPVRGRHRGARRRPNAEATAIVMAPRSWKALMHLRESTDSLKPLIDPGGNGTGRAAPHDPRRAASTSPASSR